MYLERTSTTKLSPTGLAAAVGINGALIAALIFSAPQVFPPEDRPIEGYNVPITPPPPEPEVTPRQAETPSRPAALLPHVPKPEVEVPTLPAETIAGTIDILPQPPIDLSPTGPTGPAAEPAKPTPVVVGAQPDPRADFQPPYPAELRRTDTEGRVTVRVLIGTDGRVKAVEPLGSGEPAFFEATRRHALARWRFRPATQDGVPFQSWRTMSVRFVLET